MENNVHIRIKTYQETFDGPDDEPIELETFGKYGTINGNYFLIYEESEMTGFEGTTTTIKAGDGFVTVTRKGKYNMQMRYELGERNLCLYQTPYGETAVQINTKKIDRDLGSDGGRLRVDYTIDEDNVYFVKNSLRIDVEKLENKIENNKEERL